MEKKATRFSVLFAALLFAWVCMSSGFGGPVLLGHAIAQEVKASGEEEIIIVEDDKEEIVVVGDDAAVGEEAGGGTKQENTAEPAKSGFSFGISGDDPAEGEQEENVIRAPASVFLVSFLASDDTPYFLSEIEEGESVEDPEFYPELEGFSFQYWFNIYAKDWEPYDFKTPVTKDLFLRAMFMRNDIPEDMAEGEELEALMYEGGGVKSHDVIDFVLGLEYTIVMEDELADGSEGQEGDSEDQSGSGELAIVVVGNPEDEAPSGDDVVVVEGEEETEPDITIESDPAAGDTPDEEVVVVEGEGVSVPGTTAEGQPEAGQTADPLAADAQADGTVPEEETPLPSLENCTVKVSSTHSTWIVEGEVIEVWGELTGFENLNVSFQWQFDAGDGWVDVVGATSLRYAFVATSETVNYNWRLAVVVGTK